MNKRERSDSLHVPLVVTERFEDHFMVTTSTPTIQKSFRLENVERQTYENDAETEVKVKPLDSWFQPLPELELDYQDNSKNSTVRLASALASSKTKLWGKTFLVFLAYTSIVVLFLLLFFILAYANKSMDAQHNHRPPY
jgi:hypothetical protein